MKNFSFNNFGKSMENLRNNFNKAMNKFEKRANEIMKEINEKIDDLQTEKLNHVHECDCECKCEHCNCHENNDEITPAVEPEFDLRDPEDKE